MRVIITTKESEFDVSCKKYDMNITDSICGIEFTNGVTCLNNGFVKRKINKAWLSMDSLISIQELEDE